MGEAAIKITPISSTLRLEDECGSYEYISISRAGRKLQLTLQLSMMV